MMKRSLRIWAFFASILWLTAAAPAPGNPASNEIGYDRTSAYVEVKRDGVRLAVDVYLPQGREAGVRLPALLELTRYWRGAEHAATGEAAPLTNGLDRFFLSHGYALVKVDVRGSGASFGTRPAEYGPEEVRDGYDVVDWVVRQSWSNGRVGAYGTSYTGTTAELLAASGHPAVKAVIPGWSDYDVYASPVRPYGLLASGFIQEWSGYVDLLDANNPAVGGLVRRVDADEEGRLRAAAVKEHDANPDVYQMASAAEFRDQKAGPHSLAEASSLYWKKQIEASGVPMLVLASWLDAGTADGALRRFQHYSNPQKLLILASSHGGGTHASPYAVGGEPLAPLPSGREQADLRLRFFDHYLKDGESKEDPAKWPAIRYFNLSEEVFHETDIWPPAGSRMRSFFLVEDGSLASEPSAEAGEDVYQVDYDVTTGRANRWFTQMGNAVLNLDDRGAMDERMLTYTSSPLEADLQVTGTPVVHLSVSTNRDDGAVLIYLEDVDPTGRSRYVTEGGLRFIHRRLSKNPYHEQTTPYRSFAQADASGVVPGEAMEVVLELHPTSVLVRRGHRLRLAIAGADADTFDRLPASGETVLHVARGEASRIELPVLGDSK